MELHSQIIIALKKRGRNLSDSPTWTRTRDRVINSHLLYQLSYRGMGVTQTLRFYDNRDDREPQISTPLVRCNTLDYEHIREDCDLVSAHFHKIVPEHRVFFVASRSFDSLVYCCPVFIEDCKSFTSKDMRIHLLEHSGGHRHNTSTIVE